MPLRICLFISVIYYCSVICAQNSQSFGNDITYFSNDSSLFTQIGLRVQTLYIGRQDLDAKSWEENFLIRRSRLKFDGYVFNPDIRYKFEFGLSNNDTRRRSVTENGQTANFILDAVIKWRFAKNWEFWAGQTKLPGNRERVISSQSLQFVDRSLVNALFNLDRDLGIQLHHHFSLNRFLFRQSLALSKGEGRNIIISNPESGRQHTLRFEFLPFGSFTDRGDYFGSDLAREPKPKLSIGISGDLNSDAVRSRGNLGQFVRDTISTDKYLTSDLITWIVDGIFKYRGISVTSEYIHRDAPDRKSGFGYGQGFFGAIGYLISPRFELAGRYTSITPISGLTTIQNTKEYTLGASWYIKEHDLKVEGDFSYLSRSSQNESLVFRLQCELAI